MIIVLLSGALDVTVTPRTMTIMLLNVRRALQVCPKEETMKMNKEKVWIIKSKNRVLKDNKFPLFFINSTLYT